MCNALNCAHDIEVVKGHVKICDSCNGRDPYFVLEPTGGGDSRVKFPADEPLVYGQKSTDIFGYQFLIVKDITNENA